MIDYKLAKEIGATHIHVNGDFYKLLNGKWMNYPTFEGESDWEESSIEGGRVGVLLSEIKRTRTEYEKVTESIFDLRDYFECGMLFFLVDTCRGKEYFKVEDAKRLGSEYQCGNLFLRVEKEIDWRDEVSSDFAIWFDDGYVGMKCQRFSEENFLEMCRVALRANGEIE